MGKSLELLGLATFNVFIAIILSATFLSGGGGTARVTSLTEAHVEKFINDVSVIANGKSELDEYAITSYLIEHVKDEGVFKTTVRYSMPDGQQDERILDMNKMSFISNILQGLETVKSIRQHETKITVDFIRVSADGKTAEAVTTTLERGMMETDEGMGPTLMPVNGTSYCEQNFELSDKRIIQMTAATCTSDISFSESM